MRRDATLRAWKHARLGFALLAAAVGSVAEGCANDRPIERRQAPANFGFVLETGWGEKVDTFRGLVTKDLVADPDTTIALALSGAELDSIYQKVEEVRLFELPVLHAPTNCGGVPSTWVRLEVRSDTRERQFRWEYWWACSGSLQATKTWKGLVQVVELIRSIVSARPEYKALPRPRGAYM